MLLLLEEFVQLGFIETRNIGIKLEWLLIELLEAGTSNW